MQNFSSIMLKAKGKQPIANSQEQIEVMLELLRSAVLDREPAISEDVVVDWDLLMERSSNQGILAWVYDGICKLSKEQQPPRQQRINWALSAQEIWDRYAKQKEVLADMVKVCDENDMRLLLLKGIGLSELYPKPESRPSGDIDVFFFENFEKGNKLFSDNNDPKFDKKHTEFEYKGVKIENHLMPIDADTKQRKKVAEYLNNELADPQRTHDGYYRLQAIPNLVYLLMHLLHHIKPTNLVSMRMFIDVYLYAKTQIMDFQVAECISTLDKLGLRQSFNFVVSMSESLLGDSFDRYHQQGISRESFDAARMYLVSPSSIPDTATVRERSKSLWHYYQQNKVICQYVPITPFQFWLATMRKQLSMILKSQLGIPSNQFFWKGLKDNRKYHHS